MIRRILMYCMIFVTCPNKKVANKIADTLLRKKLIACANILPNVKSKYWWKEKVEKSTEVLVVMKTKSKLFDDAKKEIKSLHTYSVPEIVCVKIDKGANEYLKWIKGVTK